MRISIVVSLILAMALTLPLIAIPAHLGLSIGNGKLVLDAEEISQGGPLYLILDLYYMFFIFSNVFPFTYLAIRSIISRAFSGKFRKRTGTGLGPDLFDRSRYPKVSIIIPCYNEGLNVGRAILNCYDQTYRGEIEVLVIDDGSRDNTWSVSSIFKGGSGRRDLKIYHKENGGKASALTYGVQKATGPIVLMTDGDSTMDKNAVSVIVETFRAYPDAGIVGGFVTIRNTFAGTLTKLQQLEYIITQHVIRTCQSEDGSVLIAPGPIFGMRTDLARMYPPLDRTVVEDCDLTMSILSTGYTTRAAPGARSYTEAPVSWTGWFNQRRRWIFGQFQAWRENRWHLWRNPWALYTYFTWISTTLSAVIFLVSFLLTVALLTTGSSYHSFLEFIALRTVLLVVFYFLMRVMIIAQYKETRGLVHYLPIKTVYDLINGFHTAYLYFMYVTRRGIRLRWGHRRVVVH